MIICKIVRLATKPIIFIKKININVKTIPAIPPIDESSVPSMIYDNCISLFLLLEHVE